MRMYSHREYSKYTDGDSMKNTKYNDLFPNQQVKADAFDLIAERYFDMNFGTMQKSDFETLLFSIYLERILAGGGEDFSQYSDYTLAKELGIAESKVRNLKIKKELQYPHAYRWQDSFIRIWKNARYENNLIKINISDVNLFREIKNAIEETGGYIERHLTSSLLQTPPEYFIDIILMISNEDDEKQLRKTVRDALRKHDADTEFMNQQPIGKTLKELGKDIGKEAAVQIIADFCSVPNISSILKTGLTAIHKLLQYSNE